eukprot:COSAG03_NODE_478_length_7595_cov_4.439568_8_plen_147_part_00
MLRVLLLVLLVLVLLVRLVLLVLVLVLVVLVLLQPWIAFGRRDLRSDLCVSLSSHSWAASGNATCSSVDGSHRAYLTSTAHAGVHSLTGAPLTAPRLAPQREAQIAPPILVSLDRYEYTIPEVSNPKSLELWRLRVLRTRIRLAIF